MKEHWRKYRWPDGERRLHWLVVFDGDQEVQECYNAHVPVLASFEHLVDLVPAEWLHMTVLSLCPTGAAADEELRRLVSMVREGVWGCDAPVIQLGPARIDGGAVTWAVYPENELIGIQHAVRRASVEVLGRERAARQGRRWWPHVTLAYGAVDDPADEDLAGALARAGLPRVDVTIAELALVDEEQDVVRREYRWHEIERVPLRTGGT